MCWAKVVLGGKGAGGCGLVPGGRSQGHVTGLGSCPGRGRGAELAPGYPTPKEGFGTPHPPAAPHLGVEEPCPHLSPRAMDTSPPRTGLRPRARGSQPQSTGEAPAPTSQCPRGAAGAGMGLWGHMQGTEGCTGGCGNLTSGSGDSQQDMGTCKESPGTRTGSGRAHPSSCCKGCRKGDTVPMRSTSPLLLSAVTEHRTCQEHQEHQHLPTAPGSCPPAQPCSQPPLWRSCQVLGCPVPPSLYVCTEDIPDSILN